MAGSVSEADVAGASDGGARAGADRARSRDDQPGRGKRVLLVGSGDLSEETRRALDAAGAEVYRLKDPNDRQMRTAIEGGGIDSVAVVSRNDAVALRFALMVRYVSKDVPLLVTIFDQTISEQLATQVSNCRITSMADIVAPSLAGPCIDEGLTAVRTSGDEAVGLCETDGGIEETSLRAPKRRRAAALSRALFTPYDKSSGLLLYGATGLFALLVIETVLATLVLDEPLVDAFYGSAKTLATVDPNPAVQDGPAWFKVFVSVNMLIGLVLAASFTAGLVNRLVDRRLTGLLGRRAVPRRDHVVVVGLGQVGLRLCLLLRSCGIGVVAVEVGEEENVGLARELGLPVVVGRGADPSLLRRLSIPRALALAAVTSDDLDNIRVAMAGRSLDEDLRVVMRAGDGGVANETRSLFQIGLVRDVHRIAAVLIAAEALGSEAESVVCVGDEALLLHGDGRLETFPAPAV